MTCDNFSTFLRDNATKLFFKEKESTNGFNYQKNILFSYSTCKDIDIGILLMNIICVSVLARNFLL